MQVCFFGVYSPGCFDECFHVNGYRFVFILSYLVGFFLVR